jgi:hypothetical protein
MLRPSSEETHMNDASASAAGTARMAQAMLAAMLLAFTGAAVAAGAAAATDVAASKPFVRESLQQMTATVEQVSLATRELTLRGPNGKTRTIKVGPEARNLDKVRVGDRVKLSYYESLTAQMRLHDKPNVGFMNAAGEVRAAPGEKPGGAVAQSTASTVTIDSVDTKNNTVSFHRADGGASTLPVMSPEGRAFIARLKRGDVVDVMYTEALAIDVAPAPAAAK